MKAAGLSSMVILSLAVAAVLLRIPLLNGSFWLDEAAQALESTRPLSQQLQIAQDFQPPLLHLITHFAARFSHAEWWLRTIGALIPGLVTIFFTYKIAKTLFSHSTAVIVSLLLATSSFHIFYSQELRPYSLAAAFAVWSWFELIAVFFKDKQFSTRRVITLGVVTALGLFSTYLYPFVVLSQAAYVIWREKQFFKQFLLSMVAAGLLFAPWLPSLYEQLQVGQQLRNDLPGWEEVVAIPQLKSLPLTIGKFIFGVVDLEFNALYLALSSGLLILLVLEFSRYKQLFSKKISLLYCWFFIPLVTAWIVSFFIPILQPKRVLYLLPAFYLLIASILPEMTSLPKKLSSKNRGLLVAALLLIINIYGTYAYYTNHVYQRENWRAAHEKITTEYPENTAVIFGFDHAFAPWQWYDTTNYPVFTTGSLTTTDTIAVQEILKKATDYSYLLVFDYLRDLTDPDRKIETVLEGLGYTQKDIISIPNIGFIRVYARAGAVLS